MPVLQSVAALQALPGAQLLLSLCTQLPPQSTPVSSPLWTRSEQVGAWHSWAVQTPLWQSAAASQPMFAPQGAHGPPQSTPVSSPFWRASTQVGATHWDVNDEQLCELQSQSVWHPWPEAHAEAQAT